MYNFNDSETTQLNKRGYLDEDGHPSVEAYKQVFSSPSADFSQLAKNIEKHGQECPICNDRYRAASDEMLANIHQTLETEK